MSLDCWSSRWNDRVGDAKVVSELAHFVGPEDYTMDRVHVFALSDGKYVYVSESGCSCYDSSDANLEVLPLARAIDQYREYKQKKWRSIFKFRIIRDEVY